MEFNSELIIIMHKIQTITIKHKITRKIIPKNDDKQVVKLSLKRKRSLTKYFAILVVLSFSYYEKNVRR